MDYRNQQAELGRQAILRAMQEAREHKMKHTGTSSLKILGNDLSPDLKLEFDKLESWAKTQQGELDRWVESLKFDDIPSLDLNSFPKIDLSDFDI